MTFLKILSNVTVLSDAFKALWAVLKDGTSWALGRLGMKNIPLPTMTWAQRFWSALFGIVMVADVASFFANLIGQGLGYGFLAFSYTFPGSAAKAVELIADFPAAFVDMASRLSATTIKQITGIDIDPPKIMNPPDPEAGTRLAADLGSQFAILVEHIFDLKKAAKDMQTRTGTSGSFTNLAAFFGTNLLFQLRSLTIATVANLTGWHTLRHLEMLHQSINWAYGFGWLSWAVMSEYINVTVTPGVRRALRGQVLPNDYTMAEARWAWWAGYIDDEILLQISQNEGIRPDTRLPLLERAQAELSDANILELWQHQRLDKPHMVRMYRDKGYGEIRTEQKIALIMERRKWDLIDSISRKYVQLYRDCVVDANELKLWLSSQGWTDLEIDLQIAEAELDRRSRKWLTESDLNKLLDMGVLDALEVQEYLVCQGMTELDAAMKVLLLLEKRLPEDCLDKIKPGDIAPIINAMLAALFGKGVFTLPPGLLKLAQCLGETPFPIPGPPGKEPKEPAPKLPKGSFATLPSTATVGDPFRLQWSIENADSVEIDHDIGKVPPQGVRFLTASENIVYVLTAKNKAGTKTFQASLLVKPKPEPKPATVPPPTASLSVTPSRATEGDTVAVTWSTTRAEQVFLDDGTGPRALNPIGGFFMAARQNTVFTLTASGPGGQRSATDALIVRPAHAPKRARITASISVTPGRVKRGEEVEIRWSTSNADSVVLLGLGSDMPVAASGVIVVRADLDRIITVRAVARDTGESKEASDAMIVLEPTAPKEPTEPPPTVSLTVRPSIAKAGQEVALEWRTSHATLVTLVRGNTSVLVEPDGATTIVAETSEIIVLHAVGPGGEEAIAKVLIVR